jgi:tRNA threonylcarbamoyladenosine biosynthesis protein TsaB
MACLLIIETSTTACSVHLSLHGSSVFNQIQAEGSVHSALLGVFVAQAVDVARKNQLTVDAVAVSAGPGSYTGLRIGVSEAKGLCYGLDIPLIAIPTLKILASLALRYSPYTFTDTQVSPYLCPMIDARRMEVYAAIYDTDLNEIRPAQADIIDAGSYQTLLDKQPVIFCGNGSNKCKEVIQSPNALFLDAIYPTAEAMLPLAETAYALGHFVDVAYFEPFYLKEFQATVARNKLL